MLKSKIHRAIITEANLYYEGSFTIDEDLMDAAEIASYEKVAIVNINNGERFETYVIPGERGGKTFCLNGAAARKGEVGDEVIIISYAILNEKELECHKPKVILVDKNNNIIKQKPITESNDALNNNKMKG